METETLSISLPSGICAYIEARVQSGEYGDMSEFIQELVRRDQEAQNSQLLKDLQEKLLAGVASLERGDWEEVTPEYWEKIRTRARARLAEAGRQEA